MNGRSGSMARPHASETAGCSRTFAATRSPRSASARLSIRDAIKIEFGGHEATVKKAMIGFRDRFHVEVEHGEDLTVKGNIVDHDYEIERDGKKIGEVSKKWLRARDTYGVEVRDDADTVLVLAVTVAVDALAHD